MTNFREAPMTLVVGSRVFHIKMDRSAVPRAIVVNVDVDYERSWRFEEPGWQEIAFGIGDVAYWWSARHLVTLPTGEQGEPAVISTDEDIRLVFVIPDGWILICETSVRLIIEGRETSRLESGEVLLAARWEGSLLVITDANGSEINVAVADGRLTPRQDRPDPAEPLP